MVVLIVLNTPHDELLEEAFVNVINKSSLVSVTVIPEPPCLRSLPIHQAAPAYNQCAYFSNAFPSATMTSPNTHLWKLPACLFSEEYVKLHFPRCLVSSSEVGNHNEGHFWKGASFIRAISNTARLTKPITYWISVAVA